MSLRRVNFRHKTGSYGHFKGARHFPGAAWSLAPSCGFGNFCFSMFQPCFGLFLFLLILRPIYAQWQAVSTAFGVDLDYCLTSAPFNPASTDLIITTGLKTGGCVPSLCTPFIDGTAIETVCLKEPVTYGVSLQVFLSAGSACLTCNTCNNPAYGCVNVPAVGEECCCGNPTIPCPGFYPPSSACDPNNENGLFVTTNLIDGR